MHNHPPPPSLLLKHETALPSPPPVLALVAVEPRPALAASGELGPFLSSGADGGGATMIVAFLANPSPPALSSVLQQRFVHLPIFTEIKQY